LHQASAALRDSFQDLRSSRLRIRNRLVILSGVRTFFFAPATSLRRHHEEESKNTTNKHFPYSRFNAFHPWAEAQLQKAGLLRFGLSPSTSETYDLLRAHSHQRSREKRLAFSERGPSRPSSPRSRDRSWMLWLPARPTRLKLQTARLRPARWLGLATRPGEKKNVVTHHGRQRPG